MPEDMFQAKYKNQQLFFGNFTYNYNMNNKTFCFFSFSRNAGTVVVGAKRV